MNKPHDPSPERRLAIDQLDRAIVRLAAKINASNYELLVLVREFDERGGWLKWGFENCTRWLHWRCDLSMSAAREKVRVAHALKGLAEISGEFAKGSLSYSKVRALTRVANAANEASLLAFAMTTTASRVEERCRQMRNVEPESVEDANRAHRGRSLRRWRDERRGMMAITVELPVEDGMLVAEALDRACETGDGPDFEESPWHARQADALVTMARSYLSGGSDSEADPAPVHQVVIHVDESALAEGEGRSDLPVESVRRLTCDGSVVRMVASSSGEPLSVGRKQRTAPTAIKRALLARDRGCSFPGCTHTRFVDAHHVQHWSQGGETSIENLLLLCSRHHRLVHEGGYEIRKDLRGDWFFRRPDGRAIPSCGFQSEDVIDEGASAEVLTSNRGASAEAPVICEPTPMWGHRGASAEGWRRIGASARQ